MDNAHHQQKLQEQLTRLQRRHDLETRVEEQMRLESLMTETRLALVQQLRQEAHRIKRNGAYCEAIAIWREIHDYDPFNSVATREIATLETLHANQTKAVGTVSRLAFRMKDIRPIFSELAKRLKLSDDTPEYQAILEQTEAFLDGKLDASDFLDWYAVMKPSANNGQEVNIEALARRVKKGEMVLFLGSEVVSSYCDEPHEERALVGQLAKKIGYTDFDGTLSSIAEYYQWRPDLGVTSLLDNLRQSLPDAALAINLYHALTKINVPLILISAGYDNLLESTFLAAGKRFVELASIMRRSKDYDIGHVLVSFSDNSQAPRVYPEEELSRLRLLENGYSVIYKIRGTCESGGSNDTSINLLRRDAMTLSESNYFSFARYADRIIPDYLAHEFRCRGFLFIGYRPKEWEDRLLVSALLEKRRNAQEPCYVIGNAPQTGEKPKLLESAFWEHRNVKQYHVDFRELDAYLQGVGV